MQSLSKIPVLTASNFNNFKSGDLFRIKNSEMVCLFIEYFESFGAIYIKAINFDHIIEEFKYRSDNSSEFLNSYTSFFRVLDNSIIVF